MLPLLVVTSLRLSRFILRGHLNFQDTADFFPHCIFFHFSFRTLRVFSHIE